MNMFAKWVRKYLQPHPPDEISWQRRLDARFSLVLDSETFFLYDDNRLICRFVWKDIIEVQHLSRKEFPPLFRKIISKDGEWFVPIGGRYGELLREKVYALSNYSRQQLVHLDPPPGYEKATSVWRLNDSLPLNLETDWDEIGEM
jgi:hypothetical protein